MVTVGVVKDGIEVELERGGIARDGLIRNGIDHDGGLVARVGIDRDRELILRVGTAGVGGGYRNGRGSWTDGRDDQRGILQARCGYRRIVGGCRRTSTRIFDGGRGYAFVARRS